VRPALSAHERARYLCLDGLAAGRGCGKGGIRENGARLLRTGKGRPLGGRAPTGCASRSHGALRIRVLSRPADRSTWPLSLLAGTRAKTLAALAYAASKPSLPRPHAELDAWLTDDERATRGDEPTGKVACQWTPVVRLASNRFTISALPIEAGQSCGWAIFLADPWTFICLPGRQGRLRTSNGSPISCEQPSAGDREIQGL